MTALLTNFANGLVFVLIFWLAMVPLTWIVVRLYYLTENHKWISLAAAILATLLLAGILQFLVSGR